MNVNHDPDNGQFTEKGKGESSGELTEREKYYLKFDNNTFNQIPDEEKDMAITAWIKSGRLGKNTLSLEKQSFHKGGSKGQNKSYVNVSDDTLRHLYEEFSTKGEYTYNRNTGENVREYIEDAGIYIGYYRTKEGQKIKTMAFTIDYSKNVY